MTHKPFPHRRNGVPLYRFDRDPRFTVPGWDQTMLTPVGPPRSSSADWARCARLSEVLGWLSRDVRANVKCAHAELLRQALSPIVSTAVGLRGRRRSYPLPSRLPEDTRDPIVILLQTMEHLLALAVSAVQDQEALPPEELLYLICRTDAALRLKGAGIDVRFDLLEELLSLLNDLAGVDEELVHAQ